MDLGSTLQRLDQPPEEDFNWLRQSYRGPTFNSYRQFSHLPACSFDWGEGGYAGCSNYGGELLFLSRPSTAHGLLMARGHFSTTPYAALSRAQIEFGGPSTFGLELANTDFAYDAKDESPRPTSKEEYDVLILRAKREKLVATQFGSTFQLGPVLDRGCFNYRWPMVEYSLKLHPDQSSKLTDVERKNITPDGCIGTCQMFSCAKNGIFYQVLRLEEGGHFDARAEGCRHFPLDGQAVITIGSPVWFQRFSEHRGDHKLSKGQQRTVYNGNSSLPQEPPRPVAGAAPGADGARAGDEDAASTEKDKTDVVIDDFKEMKTTKVMRYWDKHDGIGLEAKVYQLEEDGSYTELELFKSFKDADSGPPDVQSKAKVRAYNAIVKFPQAFGGIIGNVHHQHRSVTVVAAIRLYEVIEADPAEASTGREAWPDPPTSEELYEHVDADPGSSGATGVLWQNVFLVRRELGFSAVELAEFTMVGRALEKILQVDVIPATFDSEEGSAASPAQINALVSDLFVHANVDLQALFWKVRFLAKTSNFLAKFKTYLQKLQAEQLYDGISDLKKVERQQRRIQDATQSVARYLVRALLQPVYISGKLKSETRLMPDRHVWGESNYYYVLMTLRYLVNNCPGWEWDWLKTRVSTWDDMPGVGLLERSNRLPSDNWTFLPADREKVQLLMWYHYGSKLQLCNEGFLPKSWLDGGRLEQKVASLAKGAKVVAAAKLSSAKPYSADDEIFDRLSFLSAELGLELPQSHKATIGTVAALSMKRVKDRDYTRFLNPGVPTQARPETSGPWEIHALCHHSRLMVLIMEELDKQEWRAKEHTKEEAERYKSLILKFMNGEGTLIPCWERAHANARRGWLRPEATAVVASTFLAILDKQVSVSLEELQRTPTAPPSPAGEGSQVLETALVGFRTQAHNDQRRLLREILHTDGVMKHQLDVMEKFTNETGRPRPIQWESFRPPPRNNPDSFFNSLEDTPDCYRYDELKELSLPISLRNYVKLPGDVTDIEKQHIVDILPLKALFLVDLRADGQDLAICSYGYDTTYDTTIADSSARDLAEKTMKESQEKFTWALYDSLVDQEVQHRFMTIRSSAIRRLQAELEDAQTLAQPQPVALSPSAQQTSKLLELLVYVLHRESAGCLANHVLRFSRFSCQVRSTWVSAITLRSWRVRDEALSAATPEPRQSNPRTRWMDDDPFRLPEELNSVWGSVPGVSKTTLFELHVSSIVISTNEFGDFSKCTIISDLLSEQDIQTLLVPAAARVLQEFVHQPQTARCIFFFLILGKICQLIAREYTVAIERLTSILELEAVLRVKDKQLAKDDDHPKEYQLGIWSLERLYKLQNSLKATENSVLQAKKDLTEQIKEGPGKRGVALEQMCEEYLEKFENSIVQLSAVSAQLARKIELNTRLTSATSAVLTMRDSRTAVRQNSTVERLTYLTILYLPIGLLAAIYAIPPEQQVLLGQHGPGFFALAIIVVSLATWALAFIGDILDKFRKVWDPTANSGKGGPPRNRPPPSTSRPTPPQPGPSLPGLRAGNEQSDAERGEAKSSTSSSAPNPPNGA